jgi:hypothetical protein
MQNSYSLGGQLVLSVSRSSCRVAGAETGKICQGWNNAHVAVVMKTRRSQPGGDTVFDGIANLEAIGSFDIAVLPFGAAGAGQEP